MRWTETSGQSFTDGAINEHRKEDEMFKNSSSRSRNWVASHPLLFANG
jgi:hypothetical protein